MKFYAIRHNPSQRLLTCYHDSFGEETGTFKRYSPCGESEVPALFLTEQEARNIIDNPNGYDHGLNTGLEFKDLAVVPVTLSF